ncbi:MAG: electron transfer flavoprotein subunit alpha [Candidatus Dactylopiibacterium carminicum]|nr:MAG: electron transfer flavoprotein subunit alpha [Candidatus Dactylopiibacterium carminicum]
MSVLFLVDVQHAAGRMTLAALAVARELAPAIDVMVCGTDAQDAARALAGHTGVARVRVLDAPHYAHGEEENLSMVIAQFAGAYRHVVFAADPFGRSLAPRVAAMLDVAPVTDVLEILDAETFRRPLCAGALIETVRCQERVKVLTAHPSSHAEAVVRAGSAAPVEKLAGPDLGVRTLISRSVEAPSGPATLGAAQIVVAGGLGLGSAEAFRALLAPLAARLGAALAATRAAVDAGFAPGAWQIGQSGRVVAPRLYIAVGLSGSRQHLAGMRSAGCVVAINRDPDAPIVKLADYALIGDLHEQVPLFLKALG